MAKKKRKNTLLYVLLGVIILLVVAVVIKRKNQPDGEKVQAEKVESRTIKETVSASGKVFPVTEVNISSDVSGEIVGLEVEEGDSVFIGQLLAKVNPDTYQSQVERGVAGVNSSKAQLANSRSQIENFKGVKEQIQAQLDNARKIHKRNEKLFKDGIISNADYESSLSNVEALEANFRSAEANIRAAKESTRAAEFQVKSSEASLKELRASLKKTNIFAPMSGIVSKLNVEEGERIVGSNLMSGTEIMRIADLNDMEVQVEVSENDIPRINLRQYVEIEIDAYLDRKFKGTVSKIAHSANNTTSATGAVVLTTDQVTNFVVTINIDPKSYEELITPQKPFPFRPGMSASVEIFTKTLDEALSIPIQAVTTREIGKDKKAKVKRVNQSKEDNEKNREDEKEVLFVVMEGDTVNMVEVKTGIQDDTYIQILSGLTGDEEVVTGPYAAISRKLKQGMKVRVVDEDELFGNKKK